MIARRQVCTAQQPWVEGAQRPTHGGMCQHIPLRRRIKCATKLYGNAPRDVLRASCYPTLRSFQSLVWG